MAVPETGSGGGFRSQPEWLVMVYMSAANDLEPYALADIQEMTAGAADSGNPGLFVTVLFDRTEGYSSSSFLGDEWSDTGLYLVSRNGIAPLDGSELDGVSYNLPNTVDGHHPSDERNMGDLGILSDFIAFSTAYIPAEHRALVMWNHGAGVRAAGSAAGRAVSAGPEKQICLDDESGDWLYTDEVQRGLVEAGLGAGNRLDNIAFDACLMGMAEEAYEYRNFARTVTASMANEWGAGWDYERLLGGMARGQVTSAAGYAELTVQQYQDSTLAAQRTDQTQAAVDLDAMGDLKTEVDGLAAKLSAGGETDWGSTLRSGYSVYSGDDYGIYGLADLCDQVIGQAADGSDLKTAAGGVKTALEAAVIASYAGADYGGYSVADGVGRGLSIFFPQNSEGYGSCGWYTDEIIPGGGAPGQIDFCDDTLVPSVNTWRDLLDDWYTP